MCRHFGDGQLVTLVKGVADGRFDLVPPSIHGVTSRDLGRAYRRPVTGV
jgi:hypothetical protein